HERRRVQGRGGYQQGPAHRLRLQLPRPVLLRGPAVQVQQHGLLLRSLGAAEDEDAHERRRVQGRGGYQQGPDAHERRRVQGRGGYQQDLPIVYDSSCPGLCCFEDQPCRYNNTGCYSAALAQQKVRTPTNDAECKDVEGINKDLPIVYDSSRAGHQHGPAHRLRLQLPRRVLLRGPAVQVQQHRLLLRSLGAAEGEDDAHERRRVQGREGHQHGPAYRLRLQLPRPVLLRGPAVQVQQHGLLLRSLGAAEGEDAVKGINTGLPIVYDSSCPGLCCFEDQPCRYNNTGCY
ncbi:unnamed protein product, partial [Prorocentrum cordatum]